jgi:hypothetical protein
MVKNLIFCGIGLSAISWIATISPSLSETLSNTTMWKPVDKSLTELLNSGWKIIGHGTNRVATSGYIGVIAYDEVTYTFVLYKDGKNITCLVGEPRPGNTVSRCRQLN